MSLFVLSGWMLFVLVVGCSTFVVDQVGRDWPEKVVWLVFWLVCWVALLGRCVCLVCFVGVFFGVVVGFNNGANFSLP